MILVFIRLYIIINVKYLLNIICVRVYVYPQKKKRCNNNTAIFSIKL